MMKQYRQQNLSYIAQKYYSIGLKWPHILVTMNFVNKLIREFGDMKKAIKKPKNLKKKPHQRL